MFTIGDNAVTQGNSDKTAFSILVIHDILYPFLTNKFSKLESKFRSLSFKTIPIAYRCFPLQICNFLIVKVNTILKQNKIKIQFQDHHNKFQWSLLF
jgi:hypothetical protein